MHSGRAPANFRILSDDELTAVSGGEYSHPGFDVIGQRPSNGWSSITTEDLALLGIFNFGSGIQVPELAADQAPGDGGSGLGEPNFTTVPDAEKAGCPPGQTCTPEEGTNGMFVRGQDGKIYFSPEGVDRAKTGADTNWAGVLLDLVVIAGGSLAGIGPSVINVLGMLLGMAGTAIQDLIED